MCNVMPSATHAQALDNARQIPSYNTCRSTFLALGCASVAMADIVWVECAKHWHDNGFWSEEDLMPWDVSQCAYIATV